MPGQLINRVKRLAAIAFVFGVAGSAIAEGGPPMITDDPGTPGDGIWEFNIAWTIEHAGSETEHEMPLLDINYGIGDRVQLKYEVPWIVANEPGVGSRDGLGNSKVGVKWRFIDAGEEGWRISTYPQLEIRNPGSGSVERELVEAGATVILPFEFERAFQHFSANFEIGHTWHSRGENEWFGGIVIGREVSKRLELMAEVVVDASARMECSVLTMNIGARWSVTEHGTLLLSVGRNLHNHLDEHEARIGYVGWQVIY